MNNEQMIEHWNGPGGQHWAAEQARYDRMNARYAELIIDAVAPEPGQHTIDIGCGNGALTLALAERIGPTGKVVGVDVSAPMLEVAARRARDAGLSHATFKHADAQHEDLGEASFDALVSRFGVMFFADPHAAFKNLARTLRPGGRLAFTCWQNVIDNEWIMVPATAALEHVPLPALGAEGEPGPFSLADPTTIRQLLSAAGLHDIDVAPAVEPMYFGEDINDAVTFMRSTEFAETLFADATESQAEAAWNNITKSLRPHADAAGVHLTGAAWLVTAER